MLLEMLIRSGEHMDDQGGAALVKALSQALVFRVDNVSEYLCGITSKSKYYDAAKEIPNVAPAAPSMWFEYNGRSVGDPEGGPYGCLLTVDYERGAGGARKWVGTMIDSNTRWILRAEYFSWDQSCLGIMSSDWIYFYSISDSGTLLDFIEPMPSPRGLDQTSVPDETQKHKWHHEILTALMTLCFSHCKGAVVQEEKPSRQVLRAAQRTGKRPIIYRTIDIRPATKVLRDEGKIDTNGITRALHICRGHFAHYTDDHPLFGKHTGTFYIPMHVRGNKEKGVIVKDYRSHVVPRP